MAKASSVYLGPAVSIFVRHSTDCPDRFEGGAFKHCKCLKHLRWFDHGKKKLKATKSRDWAGAERAKREKEIELDPNQIPDAVVPDSATIEEAIQTFVTSKRSINLAKRYVDKVEYQLGLLEQFAAKRGKFHAHQLTREDAIAFRATWSWPSNVTRQKAQQNYRSFFRFYVPDAQRLKELTDALDPIKLTRVDRKRLAPRPYSEEEIQTLLGMVPDLFSYDPIKIVKMRALIHLQVATGLAIVDALTLERSSIRDGWLRIERRKTGRPVRQRLDPSLHSELVSVANSNPIYVFWNGNTLTDSITGLWQEDFRTLMKAAGLYVKGNLSHRFRDTAVDYWLGQGWTLTDVADALGDTVAIVERHYKDLASKRTEERFAKLPVRAW